MFVAWLPPGSAIFQGWLLDRILPYQLGSELIDTSSFFVLEASISLSSCKGINSLESQGLIEAKLSSMEKF